jgi:hypothetical protein
MQVFLSLSAALTGFSQFELLSTSVAAEMLDTLETVLPEGVVAELLSASEKESVEALANDPKLGAVVERLTELWYNGRWYSLPDAWHALFGFSPLDVTRVVSGRVYQAGLQWVVAGAHPPGGLQQGYGAWAHPPEGSAQ